MANLYQFQKNLQKISSREDLVRIAFEAIKETKKIAIALQKGQLSEGRNNEDEVIGTYARSTEIEALFGKAKPRKPKEEGQPYNYEWGGKFVDGMDLLFNQDEFSFWSTAEHTQILVDKWENLLGLDDYNLFNYIKNQVLPLTQIGMRKALQLD